ncbi:MAG: hypothetical protein CL528_02690 [Aequorivita sp.]|jgi:hypothetical protein|nr:hypothetical protein [Aequorivita sp.]MBP40659.1 hypothetical protein [Aequorivita sp.]HBC05706.1 hypothetical protein [Aequorivita sp.]|tara:strand:- start:3714 stop:4919 length:1206 start_codon:yes stop_codon:yes gene_type:complete
MKKLLKNASEKLSLLVLCSLALIAASCSSDDPVEPPVNVDPIQLDCDYFIENRTLVDNPNAPIDYIVSCVSQVRANLIVEPGVVIAFTPDSGLILRENVSSIQAVGTANKPIVFTGTQPTRGSWRGIFVESENSSNIMEFVTVSYGGGQAFNSNGDRGNVIVYADGALTLKNCTVINSQTSGLNAVYRNTRLTLQNNVFSGNANPLLINTVYATQTSATDNYSGNDLDRVLLYNYSAEFENSSVWKKVNVPYRVLNTGISGVNARGELTIEPGVTIEMSPGTEINIRDTGGLKMVGNAANPITIKGVSNTPGSWVGIKIDGTNPMNEIAFATISNAGEDPSTNKGAIDLWYNAKLSVHDTQFKDLASCGVYGRLLGGQTSNPNYSSYNLTFTNTPCSEFFE